MRSALISQQRRKLQLELLEDRRVLAAVPYGAEPISTNEYMLEDIYGTVVLPQSNGAIAPVVGAWTPAMIDAEKQKVTEGRHVTLTINPVNDPPVAFDRTPKVIESVEADDEVGPLDTLLVLDRIARDSHWGALDHRTAEGEAVSTWAENAESGLGNVNANISSSYQLIQSEVVSEGNFAFHLAHPETVDNYFEIDRDLLVDEQTKLFFMSRLGWATSTQIATVELSLDGGATWPHQIFTQPGTGDSGEQGFSLRQVDLTSYAGQIVRVRFVYKIEFGSRFPQTDPGIGWHIDDIQIGSEFQKTLHSIGEPTNEEQLYLERINQARADAVSEGQRLAAITDPEIVSAYNFFGVDPENIILQFTEQSASGFLTRHGQPLSFHVALLQAARTHSQDMLNNQFQGHTSSSNPPAPFSAGLSPTQRAAAFGYSGGVGENVFAYAKSVDHGHAGFTVDWGGGSPSHPDYNPDYADHGMQNPTGHRRNIHNGDYREAGIGVVNGTDGSLGPQVVTQKFSSSGPVYVTGVVFDDLNGNGVYDPGEGRSGVRVDVDGAAHYAISTQSGGYSVPVSGGGGVDGSVDRIVTFSGGGFATYQVAVSAKVDNSAKVDYLVEEIEEPTNFPPQFTSDAQIILTESVGPPIVLENWFTDVAPGPLTAADELNTQSVSFEFFEVNVPSGLMVSLLTTDFNSHANDWPRSADLSIFPAPHAHGQAVYDLVVTDNHPTNPRSTTQRLTITIEPVNDPPVAASRLQNSNPNARADVNDDGEISPMDALLIINYLNSGRPTDVPADAQGPPFVDVDGNGRIEPLDALGVINALNRLSRANRSGAGEGEAVPWVAAKDSTERDLVQESTRTWQVATVDKLVGSGEVRIKASSSHEEVFDWIARGHLEEEGDERTDSVDDL